MMRKKDVEKCIAPAMKAVRTHMQTQPDSNQVFEEYDGYVASLGASIVTSGLQTALAFYTDIDDYDEKKVQAYRFKVLQALAQILKEETLFQGLNQTNNGLLEFVLKPENKGKQRELKSKILAASVALKLSLRNFTHVKSPKKP